MTEKTIVSYSVIEAKDPKALVDAMHKALAEDWEPIGGIAVVSSALSGTRYLQSLVLRGTVDDNEMPDAGYLSDDLRLF